MNFEGFSVFARKKNQNAFNFLVTTILFISILAAVGNASLNCRTNSDSDISSQWIMYDENRTATITTNITTYSSDIGVSILNFSSAGPDTQIWYVSDNASMACIDNGGAYIECVTPALANETSVSTVVLVSRNGTDGNFTIGSFDNNSNPCAIGDYLQFNFDNSLPTASIFIPNADEIVMGNIYNVTISATDVLSGISALSVNIGGGSLWVSASLYEGTLNDGNWTALIDTTTVVDGPQIITAQVVDGAGNIAYPTQNVLVDNSGPTIALNSPVDLYNTSSHVFVFNFSVSDPALVNCSLIFDGTTVNYTNFVPNGTHSLLASLPTSAQGVYPWNVSCIDNASNNMGYSPTIRVSETRQIVRDNILPTLYSFDIIYPGGQTHAGLGQDIGFFENVSDAITGVKNVTLIGAGTCVGSNVTFQYSSSGWRGAGWYGNCTVSNSAPEGTDIALITFSFVDYAGNGFTTNADYEKISIDRSTPLVSDLNSNESDGVASSNQIIKFTVVATDPISDLSANAMLNGIPMIKLNSTHWTLSITPNTLGLGAGINILTVNAADNAGNTNSTTYTLTVDDSYPTITVHSPTPSQIIDAAGTVWINFTVNDNIGLSTINMTTTGGVSTALGCAPATGYNVTEHNCTALWDLSAATSGTYTLTIQAEDFANNQNSSNVSVVFDKDAPIVSVYSPSPAEFIKGTYNVTVNAQDSITGISTVIVSNGTGGAIVNAILYEGTTADGNWSALINTSQASDGIQTIWYTVQDNAGNNYSNTIDVTFDNSIPTFSQWSITNLDTSNNTPIGTVLSISVNITDSTTNIDAYSINITSIPTNSSWLYTGTGNGTKSLIFTPNLTGQYTITAWANDSTENENSVLLQTFSTYIVVIPSAGSTVGGGGFEFTAANVSANQSANTTATNTTEQPSTSAVAPTTPVVTPTTPTAPITGQAVTGPNYDWTVYLTVFAIISALAYMRIKQRRQPRLE